MMIINFLVLNFLILNSLWAKLDCEILLIPPHQERDYLLINLNRLVDEINERTVLLENKIGKAKLRNSFNGGMHAADVEYYDGIPAWVKVITTNSEMVFRHYSPENTAKITASQKLIAGPRAYISPEAHLKKQYDDLTGIFITKPEHNPHDLWLGYNLDTPHIDFTLPAGLKILDLGDGNYLIPGHPSYSKWIENAFTQFTQDQKIPQGMEDLFSLMKRRGGILKPIEMPIFLTKDKSVKLVEDIKRLKDKIEDGYVLPDHFTNPHYVRRIEPYLHRPNFTPSKGSDQFLFRGMFLELNDVGEILQDGMKIDKVVWTAVGGKGLYYTSSEQEAVSYIFQNAAKRFKGVGVVFKIKRTSDITLVVDPLYNSTNTIYKSDIDLKAENIEKVYLWGQYGLEDIEGIIKKAETNKITPHSEWTNQYNEGPFSR